MCVCVCDQLFFINLDETYDSFAVDCAVPLIMKYL